MRVTINLPESLVAEAKKVALDAGTTLTELIANALRETLARKKARPAKPLTPMPRYTPTPGQEGLQAGVDLNDTAALLDLMDGADAPNKR